MAMRTYTYQMTPSTGVGIVSSTNYASSAQSIEYSVGHCHHVVTTGVQAQGTVLIQGSNDALNFVNLTNGTTGFAGVASTTAQALFNFPTSYYKYVRCVFQPTSASSGVFMSTLSTKEF